MSSEQHLKRSYINFSRYSTIWLKFCPSKWYVFWGNSLYFVECRSIPLIIHFYKVVSVDVLKLTCKKKINVRKKCSICYIAWSAPFLKTFQNMRKLDFFRLPAPAAVLAHLGAGSLKKSNFLTFSKVLRIGPDQAKYDIA